LLLQIEDLQITFRTVYGPLTAVNGASLGVEKGESVAIIGESGAGKSTVGLAIVRLLPPNAEITGGRMVLDGRDISRLTAKDAVSVRGVEAFMIFQDPLNSLNPVKRVSHQMVEALGVRYKREHKTFNEKEAHKEAVEKMEAVRLPDPEVMIERYPHQLSGGQIQRVVIAMGLLLKPKLLIADEPTSALDVTIQAQVLKLMNDLKKEYGMSILFITHDISVAHAIADKFLVMYAGQVSEFGPSTKVLKNPLHPYTQALTSSIPTRSRSDGVLKSIPGYPPNMLRPPNGCRFHPRCPRAMDVCKSQNPVDILKDDRLVRCWLYD